MGGQLDAPANGLAPTTGVVNGATELPNDGMFALAVGKNRLAEDEADCPLQAAPPLNAAADETPPLVPNALKNPPADVTKLLLANANGKDTLLPPNDVVRTEEVAVWLEIEDEATGRGGAGSGWKEENRETGETNRAVAGGLKESA